jgi:hypothetical protein
VILREDGSESSGPKIDMTENGTSVVHKELARGQIALIKV